MGLRGATIFCPLLAAIFLREHIRPKAGVLAIGLAPTSIIVWTIFGNPAVDPLYIGLAVSVVTLGVVSLWPRFYNQQEQTGNQEG